MAKLGIFQRILSRLVSGRTFRKIEAETRTWTGQCPKCAEPFDAWDIGGIIWKKTYQTTSLIKCPHCGQRSLITISRTTDRTH